MMFTLLFCVFSKYWLHFFFSSPCRSELHDTDFDQLGAAATRQHSALGSEVPGEGDGNPLQYSRLENPMDGGAWWAAVHGVSKSETRLNDFAFTFHSHALQKEMATHSSVLAWRIPGTEEPGRLLSMGSQSWTRLKRLSSSSWSSTTNTRPCLTGAQCNPEARGH